MPAHTRSSHYREGFRAMFEWRILNPAVLEAPAYDDGLYL